MMAALRKLFALLDGEPARHNLHVATMEEEASNKRLQNAIVSMSKRDDLAMAALKGVLREVQKGHRNVNK